MVAAAAAVAAQTAAQATSDVVEVLVADPFDADQQAAVVAALPVLGLAHLVDCRHMGTKHTYHTFVT